MTDAMMILKLMLECIAGDKLEGHVLHDEVIRLTALAFPKPEVLCKVILWDNAQKVLDSGCKIGLIKVIQMYTNLGLKEAKEVSESGNGYDGYVMAKLPHEQARKMQDECQQLGFSVTVLDQDYTD
jgi:hypothetical protein